MSIRQLDTNLFTPGIALGKRDPEEVKPVGSGSSFQETLAAAAGKGTFTANVSEGARKAEFLHLAMMRNALSPEGSPAFSPASPPASAGWLETLMGTRGVEEQRQATPAHDSISPATPGNAVQPAAPETAAQAVPGNGADPSITAVIGRASRRYGVQESLIKAVIQAESNFKPTAVSPAGAQGLMQLMPATAAGMGVTDSFNPEQNIMAGTRFLKDLLNRYGGDLDKALAAYNWGPGNVDRGKSRLPQETRDYLVKVKKLNEAYSSA